MHDFGPICAVIWQELEIESLRPEIEEGWSCFPISLEEAKPELLQAG